MTEPRSGRTTDALRALPDGAIYVVAGYPEVRRCRHLLADDGRNPSTIMFVTLDEAPRKLRGLRQDVVIGVDHFVWESASRSRAVELRRLLYQYSEVRGG